MRVARMVRLDNLSAWFAFLLVKLALWAMLSLHFFCVLACKNLVVMSLQSYLAYRRTVTSDEHKSDQSGDCRDRADI